MRKKKILIIYASFGHGHKTAAKALEEAFIKLYKDTIDLKVIDALDFNNRFFKKFYAWLYLWMVKYVPKVWGFFYRKYDYINYDTWTMKMVRFFERINGRRLKKFVKEFEPDHVISTHFQSGDLLTDLDIKHSMVVTDYKIHSFWIRKSIQNYFVGSKESKWYLETNFPLSSSSIIISGIPVSLKFSEKKNREEFLEKLDLDLERKTILFLAGAAGTSNILKHIRSTQEMGVPLNVISNTGRNKNLHNNLKKLSLWNNVNHHLIGFVTNMQDYIRVADVVVTKPGGLSTSECIAMGKPMLLFSPIPGQEEGNAEFFLEQGAAIRCDYNKDFKYKLKYLLTDENRLNQLTERAEFLSKPDAAEMIVNKVMSQI